MKAKKDDQRRTNQGAMYGVSAGVVFTAGLLSCIGAIAIVLYSPAYNTTIVDLLFYALGLSAVAIALRSMKLTRDALELPKEAVRPYLKFNVRYTDEKAFIGISNVGEGTAFLQTLFTRSELVRPEQEDHWIRSKDVYYRDIRDFPVERGGMCEIELLTASGDGDPFDTMKHKLTGPEGEKYSYISSVSIIYLDTYRRVRCQTVIYDLRYSSEAYSVEVLGSTLVEDEIKRIHEHVFQNPQLRGDETKRDYVKYEQNFVTNETKEGVRQYRKTFRDRKND